MKTYWAPDLPDIPAFWQLVFPRLKDCPKNEQLAEERRTRPLDPSLFYVIVNHLFIYPSLAFAKSLFWFSMTDSKFSFIVCFFLGFPSIAIKSDDGYQIGQQISSDNHRPILCHVLSFIQWEPPEIILWVIIATGASSAWSTKKTNILGRVWGLFYCFEIKITKNNEIKLERLE